MRYQTDRKKEVKSPRKVSRGGRGVKNVNLHAAPGTDGLTNKFWR